MSQLTITGKVTRFYIEWVSLSTRSSCDICSKTGETLDLRKDIYSSSQMSRF